MATSSAQPLTISALEPKKLKALYFDFRVTQVFSMLCLVAFIILMLLAAFARIKYQVAEQDSDQIDPNRLVGPALAFTAIFYLLAAMGCTKRRTWGRILGILAAFIALPLVPVGTIIGALALFALFRSPELFGPQRLNSHNLIAEYKRRKKTPATPR